MEEQPRPAVQFDVEASASTATPAAKPERRWSGCAIGDCGTFIANAPLSQPSSGLKSPKRTWSPRSSPAPPGTLEAQIRAFESQRPSFDPDSYVYRQGRVVQFVRDATKSTKEFLSFLGSTTAAEAPEYGGDAESALLAKLPLVCGKILLLDPHAAAAATQFSGEYAA